LIKKSIILFSVFIFYYFITLIFSFYSISNAVGNNNNFILDKYIEKTNLKKNFKNDILILNKNKTILNDKIIKLQSKKIKFEGNLTESFYNKLFNKISENISEDFVNMEVLLYFYNNSNDLKIYFNGYIINIGNYSFKDFLNEKKSKKNNDNQSKNTTLKEIKVNKEDTLQKKNNENFIIKLYRKYKYTEYFFFINPIDFKLKVKHQDILFSVIFRFNGIKWKVIYIEIPYEKII